MNLKTLLIAGAACAIATSALGQSRDPNGDGKTDLAEHLAGLKTTFEKEDLNKDGKVTLGEQAQAGGDTEVRRAEIALRGADHVVLTLDKLLAGAPRDFAEMDLNKDGFLSRDETEARWRGYRDMVADGKVDKAERLAQSKAQFERLDTDKDGKVGNVTLADALARSAATFDASDTDKDGFLTLDESKAANLAAIARQAARQSQ